MEKLTENLNIIQNLSNQPTENADELKRKFDEAGNIIKNYLNDIVYEEIASKAGEEELNQLSTNLNKALEELEEAVNASMESLTTSVNNSISSVSSTANSKTSYSDLIVTQQNVTLQTDIQYGRSTKTATIYQSGYKPLAIVGTYLPYDYNQQWTLEQYRITSASNGSGTVSVTGQAGKADGNKTYSVTVTLDILWIKVR